MQVKYNKKTVLVVFCIFLFISASGQSVDLLQTEEKEFKQQADRLMNLFSNGLKIVSEDTDSEVKNKAINVMLSLFYNSQVNLECGDNETSNNVTLKYFLNALSTKNIKKVLVCSYHFLPVKKNYATPSDSLLGQYDIKYLQNEVITFNMIEKSEAKLESYNGCNDPTNRKLSIKIKSYNSQKGNILPEIILERVKIKVLSNDK